MPPQLASILTWAFVFFLFRREAKLKSDVSSALWLPTAWLLIITTRAVTTWMSMFGLSVGGTSLEEGSTIDAVVQLALIGGGVRVLLSRKFDLKAFVSSNRVLALFLTYCLISVIWSDYPFVALKRWIKNLGHPIMILVVLSERNPVTAISILIKRCGYVVAPVSILFIKYYPEWGRKYNEWNGQPYNTGITEGKNALGYDCLILAFFFVWYLIEVRRNHVGRLRRDETVLSLVFLGMVGWLLANADSKTPLVGLAIAVGVLVLTYRRWTDRRWLLWVVAGTACVVLALEEIVGIYEPVLKMLGRNASLTDRTPLWAELRSWASDNPVLGVGFESFWLGGRRELIWERLEWNPNQAHNGYLETYLNLGGLGLVFLGLLLLECFRRTTTAFVAGEPLGRFRLSFLFAIVVYNWTEASFHGLHPVFFMFFLIAIEHRGALPSIHQIANGGTGARSGHVLQ